MARASPSSAARSRNARAPAMSPPARATRPSPRRRSAASLASAFVAVVGERTAELLGRRGRGRRLRAGAQGCRQLLERGLVDPRRGARVGRAGHEYRLLHRRPRVHRDWLDLGPKGESENAYDSAGENAGDGFQQDRHGVPLVIVLRRAIASDCRRDDRSPGAPGPPFANVAVLATRAERVERSVRRACVEIDPCLRRPQARPRRGRRRVDVAPARVLVGGKQFVEPFEERLGQRRGSFGAWGGRRRVERDERHRRAERVDLFLGGR